VTGRKCALGMGRYPGENEDRHGHIYLREISKSILKYETCKMMMQMKMTKTIIWIPCQDLKTWLLYEVWKCVIMMTPKLKCCQVFLSLEQDSGSMEQLNTFNIDSVN